MQEGIAESNNERKRIWRWRGWLSRWLPALAWMAIIFFVSALPQVPAPLPFPFTDKVAHFAEYLLLGLLLCRAYRIGLKSLAGVAIWTLATGVAYAASDEIHQKFVPGRICSWADFLADCLGMAVGVAIAWRRMRG